MKLYSFSGKLDSVQSLTKILVTGFGDELLVTKSLHFFYFTFKPLLLVLLPQAPTQKSLAPTSHVAMKRFQDDNADPWANQNHLVVMLSVQPIREPKNLHQAYLIWRQWKRIWRLWSKLFPQQQLEEHHVIKVNNFI